MHAPYNQFLHRRTIICLRLCNLDPLDNLEKLLVISLHTRTTEVQ